MRRGPSESHAEKTEKEKERVGVRVVEERRERYVGGRRVRRREEEEEGKKKTAWLKCSDERAKYRWRSRGVSF